MGQENTVPRRIDGVEGAAGEVIISSGPGAVETWGPIGASVFVEDYVLHAAAGVGAWEVWDLSGDIPEGTKWVDIVMEQITAALISAGARVPGSVQNRVFSMNQRDCVTVPTQVNGDLEVEIWDGNAAPGVNFYMVGYHS